MHPSARLIPTHLPRDPQGAVVVLHGGAARRHGMRVSPAQLSVLRMVPVARRIAFVGRGRLAVFRLLNSVRGWDTHHTPVDDVTWALGQLRERLDDAVPTCLVGHSLGGRAAIEAGGLPDVRSVVALAPWVYATDGNEDLTGRRVLVVHGTEDHVASPTRALAAARNLLRTARVGFVSVEGGRHAMLRHHRSFDGYAAQFAAATLLGDPATGPVAQVLDGEFYVEA
jgi:pimeloyl-ACP methyl ester carboxylesterase